MTRRRTHPPLVVGQRFGEVTVVALLPTPECGRADERVMVACVCGWRGPVYAYALRVRSRVCTHTEEARSEWAARAWETRRLEPRKAGGAKRSRVTYERDATGELVRVVR